MSMPQGRRTEAEKIEFDAVLPNINLLYLGASVLILMDRSYLSRFWTQYEAWLSMQEASPMGLVSAPKNRQRYTIRCIHGAPPALEHSLVQEWSHCTTHSAHKKLSNPDVLVTNMSDKEDQLKKIFTFDQRIKALFVAAGAAGAFQGLSEMCAREEASEPTTHADVSSASVLPSKQQLVPKSEYDALASALEVKTRRLAEQDAKLAQLEAQVSELMQKLEQGERSGSAKERSGMMRKLQYNLGWGARRSV